MAWQSKQLNNIENQWRKWRENENNARGMAKWRNGETQRVAALKYLAQLSKIISWQ
jgi:hypothetical protein